MSRSAAGRGRCRRASIRGDARQAGRCGPLLIAPEMWHGAPARRGWRAGRVGLGYL